MVGLLHLEAVAARDGLVRVYLTDVWRRPLPLAGVQGRVTIGLPGASSELALVAGEDALEAKGPPLEGAEVAADVRLERDGQPIESLAWHRAGIYGLAWAGPVLVSGDTQGRVALWDLAERLRAP